MSLKDIAQQKEVEDPIPPGERTFLQWAQISYFVPSDSDPNQLPRNADPETVKQFNARIQSRNLSQSLRLSQDSNDDVTVFSNPNTGIPYTRVEKKGKKILSRSYPVPVASLDLARWLRF